MRANGFELENNMAFRCEERAMDRAVRNGIGRDWVEPGVRRVALQIRLRSRFLAWFGRA